MDKRAQYIEIDKFKNIIKKLVNENDKNKILSSYEIDKKKKQYYLKDKIESISDEDKNDLNRIFNLVQYNKPINPKFIGFEWDYNNEKLKLNRDEDYYNSITDESLKNEYNKHTNTYIYEQLKKKIKEDDLDFLKL